MAGFFSRLFSGFSSIDDDFYEEIFETLVMADTGVRTSDAIVEKLKIQVKENKIKNPEECKKYLKKNMIEQMEVEDEAYDFLKERSVVFVIGVNGVGKTTTIGKLAGILKKEGKKVLVAAADTFRAAAGEQLDEWAKRVGVDIVQGKEGQDPSSVLFDSIQSAKAKNVDVLLVDTAGRLHNKKNLMDELEKMNRLINSYYPKVRRENLVVLDGTTGQNALVQAKEFSQVTKLTGVILTKMDGTAKGGIAVAVQSELSLPVKFIGVGEKVEDLSRFDAEEYIESLFEERG
ncbi:MAG: signal recognition particle-docking protein FtsY [Lachnospiraceae bacterium]|nr:signal recognition particle-docking protein FtsY [Lachnospiraceae bacterium]